MSDNDGKVIIQVDTNAAKAAQDFKQLDNEIKNLNRDTQQTKTQTNNVSSGFSGASSALFSLKGAAIAAAGAFAAMKLTQFAGDIFKISSQFEQLNVAFEVLAGQSAGAQLVKDLTDLANVTPMTTQGLADNARLLLSFGEASQNVIADLKLLGDISGGNQQKMDSLALAFAQAGSAGKLMGQDLLQMVNAGFNPLQQISEKTGKSMGELRKEMEKGNISFSQIKQAMIDATSEGGRFFGMMNKQSQTLEGRLSTLADKWGMVAKNIGDFFLPAAKAATDWFIRVGDAVLRLQQKLAGLDHPVERAYIGLQKFFGILPKDSGLVFTMKTDIPEKAQKASTALSKLSTGFKDSSPEAAEKKVKKVATEYDKLTQKINVLQDKLRMMAIRGQEGTQAFANGKAQLTQYTMQLEKANRAIEIQTNSYDMFNYKLQEATRQMQILATAKVVDAGKFAQAKAEVTSLTMKLEEVNRAMHIDTSPYDSLTYKIQDLKRQLDDLAVSGQAGTPAFDKLKNDYVEATNQMKKANREVTNAMGLDWENIGKSISSDLASALTTPLQDGENAFQRFGNVAMNVISMIGQKLIEEFVVGAAVKSIANLFTGGTGGSIMSLFGFANGGAFQGGKQVQAFASGGVVSSPTLFPMANGGTGLMGEAGAEAIMPLRRGSSGRLGVEATNVEPKIIINNNARNTEIETIKRPNNEYEIKVKEFNNMLASERTQSGYTKQSQRQSSRGITAA